MLARTRLRRFVVAAIEDQAAPFGPDCDCIGPIAVNCDGDAIAVMDSPAGYVIDQITDEGKGSIGVPAIAIYVNEGAGTFDTRNEPKTNPDLRLLIELYVSGDEDWEAENCADDLQERVMYRILRQDRPKFNGVEQTNIWSFTPSSYQTRTERTKEDRRVWMRQIEITLTGCDTFEAPVCDPCGHVCVQVSTPADC